MLAASPASPQSRPLAGTVLVRIDTALGAAVLRDPGGALHVLRAGDASPDGRFRVERVFADRIEIQALSGAGKGERYWMKAGGGTAPMPVSRRPPPSAPLRAGAPRELVTFGGTSR